MRIMSGIQYGGLCQVEVSLTILKTENTHRYTHKGSYRVRPRLKIIFINKHSSQDISHVELITYMSELFNLFKNSPPMFPFQRKSVLVIFKFGQMVTPYRE